MVVQLGAREARNNFADLLGRVHYSGQVVIVERAGPGACGLARAPVPADHITLHHSRGTGRFELSPHPAQVRHPGRRRCRVRAAPVPGALLEEEALLVPGAADVAGAVPADPADEKVLACALDAGADLVVSGDHHLLDLGAYQGIPIVTVREFLERLEIAPTGR